LEERWFNALKRMWSFLKNKSNAQYSSEKNRFLKAYSLLCLESSTKKSIARTYFGPCDYLSDFNLNLISIFKEKDKLKKKRQFKFFRMRKCVKLKGVNWNRNQILFWMSRQFRSDDNKNLRWIQVDTGIEENDFDAIQEAFKVKNQKKIYFLIIHELNSWKNSC
jgi:hypothetical protein